MFTRRRRNILLIFTCLIFLCLVQIYFSNNLQIDATNRKIFNIHGKVFLIVWWTPFLTDERPIYCGEVSCFVSYNRNLLRYNYSAYLFYGTYFNKTDLPLPRKKNVWGLLHEESPRNSPLLNHEPVLSLFNFSATFSRFSDLPLTVQYLPSLESITGLEFFKTFEQKHSFDISPVIYIQSDCITPNNRDSYVYELMKYINIDSYGSCLHNKDLPQSLKNPIENMMSPELLHLISRYKFAIAFENAVCEDYITEKLWRPLIVGSVPLYVGSGSIKDWIPNNESVILPLNFISPKHLAEYLHFLSNNATAYNKYLKHKLNGNIENVFLINKYKEFKNSNVKNSFVEDFECLVCRKLHNKELGIVRKEHYNCPQPVSIVNNEYNSSNWWHDDYIMSQCEANHLRTSIDQGLPINTTNIEC